MIMVLMLFAYWVSRLTFGRTARLEEENAALQARRAEAERARGRWELVNQITARTNRLLPVEQLLQQVVAEIQERFGYFNAAVFLNEPQQRQMVLRANHGHIVAQPQEFRQSWDVGIIGHVAQTGATYVCNDTRADPYYHPAETKLPAVEILSELTVPLRRGEQILGVLDLQSVQLNAFDPSDVAAVETLADQIVAAVENARLFADETRRAQELEAVHQLSLDLIATRDRAALLQSIVERAVQLLEGDGATIYTFDAARGELVLEIAHGLPQKYVGIRLKLGEGLAGKVAAQGEPIFVRDYKTWEGRAHIYDGEPLAALLGVPLRWQARVLGVLILHRDAAGPPFTADDLRRANLFAAPAAAAIENARLLDTVQNQLQAQHALTEFSQTLLETVDSGAILQRAAASAQHALNVEAAIILLPNATSEILGAQRRGQELVAHAQLGWDAESLRALRLPVDRGSVPGRVMVTRRLIQWSDDDLSSAQAGGADALARAAGFQAGIAVPMLVGAQALGVITLNTRRPRRFSEDEAQTLSLLANQTAIALERARYFEQQQRSADELNLLFEAHRATTATLEPLQVIGRLLEQLTKALHVTSAYFMTVDEVNRTVTQAQEFFADAASPLERRIGPYGRTVSFRDYPEMEKLQSILREPLVSRVGDPELTPRWEAYIKALGGQSVLRVPLLTADQLLGYLSLWESRFPRVWSDDEIRFVQTMASHAAAALANARLYEDARTRTRELEALYQASQRLNQSLSVKEVCESSVDALRENLGYRHISIFFLQGGALWKQIQRGYDLVLERFDLAHGIMARAARTRQTVFLPDVSADSDFIAAMPNIQSEIAVPLLYGEQVIGVLNVETEQPQVLTPTDVRLLNTFANQLTIAIQNARLYEQTKRDAQVKTALLRELSHRVKNNLAAITSLLYLALDEPPEARERILLETLGRVQSMVLAHTLMARSDHARVNLVELGRQVLNDTVRQLALPGWAITVQVEGAPVDIAPRQITTLALVISELATNALRHGFAEQNITAGLLRLRIERGEQSAAFVLEDNGGGLPPDFDINTSTGLGVNLVRTLVEKDLQGHFELARQAGWTRARVRFVPED